MALNSTYMDALGLLQQIDPENNDLYDEDDFDEEFKRQDSPWDHKSSYQGQSDSQDEKSPLLKFFANTVIPVVQSKESMVIVGAVLRDDVKKTLLRIANIAHVARAKPVYLSRLELS